MAKYHGYVGYAIDVEAYPGVWESKIIEHEYFGDVIKNRLNVQQQSTSINPTLSLSNNVSIVADAFAFENYYAIRYVTYLGKRWTVTSVEISHPRMILTLGGLYNGKESGTTSVPGNNM